MTDSYLVKPKKGICEDYYSNTNCAHTKSMIQEDRCLCLIPPYHHNGKLIEN